MICKNFMLKEIILRSFIIGVCIGIITVTMIACLNVSSEDDMLGA